MGAPYVAAHNATKNPDNGYPQQETVDAIAKLAADIVSDRAAIAKLTATVARLTTEIATVNKKLVFVLQEKRTSRGSRRGRDKTTRRRGSVTGYRAGSRTGAGAGSTARTGARAPTLAEAVVDLEWTIYYCCTCGPNAGIKVRSVPNRRPDTSKQPPGGTCRARRKQRSEPGGAKHLILT